MAGLVTVRYSVTSLVENRVVRIVVVLGGRVSVLYSVTGLPVTVESKVVVEACTTVLYSVLQLVIVTGDWIVVLVVMVTVEGARVIVLVSRIALFTKVVDQIVDVDGACVTVLNSVRQVVVV